MNGAQIDAGGAGFELSLEDRLSKELSAAVSGVISDVSGMTKSIAADLKTIGQGFARVASNEIRNFGAQVESVGKSIAKVGAGATAFGAASSYGLLRATARAGDFVETVNMFEAVFKEQSAAIRQWGKDYGSVVKRSEAQMLEFLALSQDTFVPLGFDRREAAELSKTVTKLAIDLGSFKNMDDGEAIRRLLGGLVGNTENLKAFGVQATAAAIKAKALTLGFDPTNLTSYQKAMAILQITIDGTQDAQGDAIKTADEYVNSVKGMNAELDRLGVTLGTAIIKPVTGVVHGFTAMLSKVNDLLESMPTLARTAAVLAVAITSIGTAAVVAGAGLAVLGTKIGAVTALAVLQFANLGGVVGKAVTLITTGLAAIRGAILRTFAAGVGLGLKGLFAGIIVGAKALFGFVVGAATKLAAALLSPWVLLAAAIAGAIKLVEMYYRRQEQLEKNKGDELEARRQAIVAKSYRDAGQEVPADLGKTLDINKARVVPSQAAASPELDLELANEIRSMRTALQEYRDKIQNAQRLFDAGKITGAEFSRFAKAETDSFKRSDAVTQARESLREQLLTPIELFVKSVTSARELFANEPEMFKRAKEAAIAQFKANDAATQMAKQLRTPLEQYQAAIKEARDMFRNDPENLRRALSAAADAFRASSPVEQLKDSLRTPFEIFRDRMAEIREIVANAAPELRADLARRATAAARKEFEESDPDTRLAKEFRDGLKTPAQQTGEKFAEAMELAAKGLLTGGELGAIKRNLRKDFLGDQPDVELSKSIQTTSAQVAAQLGAFGPTFDADKESLEYQKKQVELTIEMRDQMKKFNKKRGLVLR